VPEAGPSLHQSPPRQASKQSVVELTEALEDAKEDAQIHNERAENALICVQMLLDESPSQFKNVSTEIGLNGVVYQFNIEETTKE